jgi:hypothetical protein
MSKLTFDQQCALKSIICDYLHGEDIDIANVRLVSLCTKYKASCIDLYKSLLIKSNDPFLLDILSILNLSPQNSTVKTLISNSNNFYELLNRLEYDGHHQLEYFLTLVDKAKPPKNWAAIFALGAIFTAGTGTFLHYSKNALNNIESWFSNVFPKTMHWLGKTLSVLRNLSALGTIYNSIMLALSWKHALSKSARTNTSKFRSLVFQTLQYGLAITAYTITCLGSGALALPIGLLFVLSSAMDVFKSIYFLIQSQKSLEKLGTPNPSTASWATQADYVRANNLHHRSIQSMLLKLTAALMITVAVCICKFAPPTALIMGSCYGFITLIKLAQSAFSKVIKERFARSLQNNISDITSEENPNPQSQTKALARLQIEWEKYKQDRAELLDERTKLEVGRAKLESDQANLKVKVTQYKSNISFFNNNTKTTPSSSAAQQATSKPTLQRSQPESDLHQKSTSAKDTEQLTLMG